MTRPTNLQAGATIQLALTEQEREGLRSYLEDYLQRADTVEAVTVQEIEALTKTRGEEPYTNVLTASESAA